MAGPFEEALPWLYYHQAGIDTVLLPLRSMTEIKTQKKQCTIVNHSLNGPQKAAITFEFDNCKNPA